MEKFLCVETETFLAFIADNSPLGIHRRGYNGVASLIPRHSGNNLFVPMFAGLNYETISLAGLPNYQHESGSKFEPRCELMYIEESNENRVVLVQPETSHAHVSARITFTVEEPHYLHQCIELTFHQRFCDTNEPNRFRSLWASYIHIPPDRHIYLKIDWKSEDILKNWFGITKDDHGASEIRVCCLPNDREIDTAGAIHEVIAERSEHLDAMTRQPLLSADELSRLTDVRTDSKPDLWSQMMVPKSLDGPLAFYYGLCHGSQLFLMMFKQPERFRLAYSPCGAGKEPAWNPAWDYVLHLDDAQIGMTYVWDVCLAVKKYQGRADILNEIRRYVGD